jgi:hypothetical protein
VSYQNKILITCDSACQGCSHAGRELLGVELVVDVGVARASNSPGEEVVHGDDDGVVDDINDEGGLVGGARLSKGGGLSIEEADKSRDGVGEGDGSTPGGDTNDEAVGEVSVGAVESITGIGVLLHLLLEVHGEVVRHGNEGKSEDEPHDDPEDGEEAEETSDD